MVFLTGVGNTGANPRRNLCLTGGGYVGFSLLEEMGFQPPEALREACPPKP